MTLKDYYVHVDSFKMMTNIKENQGVFLPDEAHFKDYISENIGPDFADCIVEEKLDNEEIIKVLDELESALDNLEELDYSYSLRNPILRIKRMREVVEVASKMRDILYNYFE